MKKILAFLLALALTASLTACGNKDVPDPAEPDTTPTVTEPDTPAETPDPAPEETPDPAPEETPDAKPEEETDQKEEISISHTDVTLNESGQTFQLKAQNVPGVYACTFTSSDPSVASVDEASGMVTAVAPGTAAIAVHIECESGQYDFECTVRCNWKEDSADQPDSPAASGTQPTMEEFFSTLQESHEGLNAMMVIEDELLDNYYPGLSSIANVEEMLIQETMISISNIAIGLVKLTDDATQEDVLAVQEALQTRATAQAEGGAMYPESCETWNQAIICSTGHYVGMFVYPEQAQELADLFTETFSE